MTKITSVGARREGEFKTGLCLSFGMLMDRLLRMVGECMVYVCVQYTTNTKLKIYT